MHHGSRGDFLTFLTFLTFEGVQWSLSISCGFFGLSDLFDLFDQGPSAFAPSANSCISAIALAIRGISTMARGKSRTNFWAPYCPEIRRLQAVPAHRVQPCPHFCCLTHGVQSKGGFRNFRNF